MALQQGQATRVDYAAPADAGPSDRTARFIARLDGPAIIGQAHLLYYARFGTTPENAEKSFAQLKRDADDLCKAIADVDAAMKEARPEKK
jgi:hypothetical protein